MKFLTKLMYTIHRILGTLLSILFLVWFLSAFVLLFHHYPSVNDAEKMEKQELIAQTPDSLPDLNQVMERIPQGANVNDIRLFRYMGQTVFEIRAGKETVKIPANLSEGLPVIDNDYVMKTAKLWNDAPIAKIDTLNKLDQWIPFGRLKQEMPIYKIFYADDAKTQLYVSSKSGQPLQMSTKSERVWAWLGAIPHWVYFTSLRQDLELWKKTVILLSGVGCIMVLAGFWVTVDIWNKNRRRKDHKFSPYKKKWYHWHYVSGIFFGIFVLAFTFSGMMSLADVPQWIHKKKIEADPAREMQKLKVDPTQFGCDYRQVLAEHPDAKELRWNCFSTHPYYTVRNDKNEYNIDATDSIVKPLELTKDEIVQAVTDFYTKEAPEVQLANMKVSELDHFETYFRELKHRGKVQLPVWKIEMNDKDKGVIYVHPKTAQVRYVDTSARLKYWAFTALHRMRIGFLNSHGTMRKGVLIVLLLGGTVASASGVALGINYLRRKCRKLKK